MFASKTDQGICHSRGNYRKATLLTSDTNRKMQMILWCLFLSREFEDSSSTPFPFSIVEVLHVFPLVYHIRCMFLLFSRWESKKCGFMNQTSMPSSSLLLFLDFIFSLQHTYCSLKPADMICSTLRYVVLTHSRLSRAHLCIFFQRSGCFRVINCSKAY